MLETFSSSGARDGREGSDRSTSKKGHVTEKLDKAKERFAHG